MQVGVNWSLALYSVRSAGGRGRGVDHGADRRAEWVFAGRTRPSSDAQRSGVKCDQ